MTATSTLRPPAVAGGIGQRFHRATDVISDFQANASHFPELEGPCQAHPRRDRRRRRRVRRRTRPISLRPRNPPSPHCRPASSASSTSRVGSCCSRTSPPDDAVSSSPSRSVFSPRRVKSSSLSRPRPAEADAPALARNVLSAYLASALVMPYVPFLKACRDYRYDIERLGHRFGTSFSRSATA